MNITCTFQITILAKFQEELRANMYDDGIKRSTFDLKILLKLRIQVTGRSEILGGGANSIQRPLKGQVWLLHIYYYLLPKYGEGRARLLPLGPTPVPTVLINLHGGGDVPVTFGGGNGGCLGAKGFEFGSNFDGTDWLPDPPFCSSPQSPPSTKRSIPADQFWYCIPESEELRLNKCFE